MTVKELKKFCLEEIRKGNGNKEVLISDDEEGNGFHGIYYAFTPAEKMMEGCDPTYLPYGIKANTMLLG